MPIDPVSSARGRMGAAASPWRGSAACLTNRARETSAQYRSRMRRLRTPEPHPQLCIEGEYVTLGEIAARLGVSPDTASRRMKAIIQSNRPVTWSALEKRGGRA